jgi:hypothetical protein
VLNLVPAYEEGISRDAAARAVDLALFATNRSVRGGGRLPVLLLRHLELAEKAKPLLDAAASDYYAGRYESALEAEASLAKLVPELRAAEAEAEAAAGTGYGYLRQVLENLLADHSDGVLYHGVEVCRVSFPEEMRHLYPENVCEA